MPHRSRTVAAAALFLLLASSQAGAQTSRLDPTDGQAWFGTQLTLDLPNRWEATLEYQLRQDHDASSYRGSYVTLQGGRKITDHISLLGNYRRAMVDDGTFNRVGFGAEYSARLGLAKISLRQMVQYQQQNFTEGTSDDDLLARTRLRVRYPLAGTLDAYASVEPYLKYGDDHVLDNWRNTVGLRYEFADGQKVKMFYLYRPDFAKSYTRTYHVVGVEFDFEFKVPWG